ncbi:prephenate dehydrogenase [Vagococcus sp.]|uniref:prephenate dehydrogenase n=1 Tax=Vagococcus sp. TaxID=1933889 RepID=UPI003F9C6F7A
MHITVIGVGLIGGSICYNLKKKDSQLMITGYSHSISELEGAKTLGLIDSYSLDLQEAVQKADVIFLCTPVRVTLKLIAELAELSLKKNVLVTDVSSTKSEIMEQASLLRQKGIDFVGGHPMAGSHKTSYVASRVDLFENAYYLLVSTSTEDQVRAQELEQLLSETKANFLFLEPQEHDEIVGLLSHLPHIIAAGLVNLVQEESQDSLLFSRLAAGGFRDITRIASSDPVMWTDILLTNRLTLIDQISKWQLAMEKIKEALQLSDEEKINIFFTEAQSIRNQLPQHKKGAIPNLYDLFINVTDEVGAIASITQLLYEFQISITNIRILETREDIQGVLQLSFRTEKDQLTAQKLLSTQLGLEVQQELGERK